MNSVSLIIPIYNEEKYINGLFETILNQDYDSSKIELILVDGGSKDSTIEKIKKFLSNTDIKYILLSNPKKITPISLNIGIKKSSNDIIIRLDAHSKYPKQYISKCVYYINEIKDADNVGCLIDTKSEGVVGNSIAYVLSSKFGVGNSNFRTNSDSGYVDTVPFGTFRRELFEKIGYFDERLIRNQDSEFNHRILKNGGKIYLFNDIKITYFPRNTIPKLIKMAYMNGKWNIYTTYLIPGSMKFRHFIPLMFVLSIIFGVLSVLLEWHIFAYLFLFEIILYAFLTICFSIKSGSFIKFVLCILIYPLFHISYGVGSLIGIFMTLMNKGEILK